MLTFSKFHILIPDTLPHLWMQNSFLQMTHSWHLRSCVLHIRRPGPWLEEGAVPATVTKPDLASPVLMPWPPWNKVPDLRFLYWSTNYSIWSMPPAFQGSSGLGICYPVRLMTVFRALSHVQNKWACISTTDAGLKDLGSSFPCLCSLFPDSHEASAFTSFRFLLKWHFGQSPFLIVFSKQYPQDS